MPISGDDCGKSFFCFALSAITKETIAAISPIPKKTIPIIANTSPKTGTEVSRKWKSTPATPNNMPTRQSATEPHATSTLRFPSAFG